MPKAGQNSTTWPLSGLMKGVTASNCRTATCTPLGRGLPGRGQLFVDGQRMGQADFAATVPITYGLGGHASLCAAIRLQRQNGDSHH